MHRMTKEEAEKHAATIKEGMRKHRAKQKGTISS
jgi:hypothetical protein